jgi:hypothetical protein
MKNSQLFVFFILSLILLTACGSTTTIPMPPLPDVGINSGAGAADTRQVDITPEEYDDTDEIEIIEEEDFNPPGEDEDGESIAAERPKKLTVYFTNENDSDEADDRINSRRTLTYLNNLLRNQGFDLEFRYFASNEDEQQEQYIRDHIHENVVFIPAWAFDLWEDEDFKSQLGNFYETGMIYAPNYTRNPIHSVFNEKNELSMMQTNFKKIFPTFPAVLIRENIAAEYGREIRTASDYIELLEWLKARDPEIVPGMTVPAIPHTSGFRMAHDFFLPEWGYWSDLHWEWYALDIRTNDARATYSLPESNRAFVEFADLQRKDLLYMKVRNRPQDRKLDEFPTALLYFYQFISNSSDFLLMSGFNEFDASGYRIYAMYGGKMPVHENYTGSYFTSSGCHAIAGLNAEVGEFLRFMEWLDVRENYTMLFYGEEGHDYTLEGGRIVPLESRDEQMAVHRNKLFFLEHNELNAVPLTAPLNYETEMYSLSPAYTLIPSEEDRESFDIFNETYGDDSGWVSYTSANFIGLYYSLFFNDDTSLDEEGVQNLIDGYVEKQQSYTDILDSYAEAFGEMCKSAAARNR